MERNLLEKLILEKKIACGAQKALTPSLLATAMLTLACCGPTCYQPCLGIFGPLLMAEFRKKTLCIIGAGKNYALENAFLGIRPPGHFLALPLGFLLGLTPDKDKSSLLLNMFCPN